MCERLQIQPCFFDVMGCEMTNALDVLIAAARTIKSSPEQRERQRRSFAYGNTHFENELITREMVDREAEKLAREGSEPVSDERR